MASHPPSMATKLVRYVALGEELIRFTAGLAQVATSALRDAGLEQSFRDRVLTGLALKIDSTFRALLDDARAARGESMHHLKTMAESFIYFYVVSSDSSDVTARRLIAKAVHEKLKFFDKNPNYAAPEEVRDWQEWRDELLGSEKQLPSLEQLAMQHSEGLGSWYSRVFRSACEPAHVGDLIEFMPDPSGGEIATKSPRGASPRAIIAISYGLDIMAALLRTIAETSEVPLPIDADDWNRRIAVVREASSQGGSS